MIGVLQLIDRLDEAFVTMGVTAGMVEGIETVVVMLLTDWLDEVFATKGILLEWWKAQKKSCHYNQCPVLAKVSHLFV